MPGISPAPITIIPGSTLANLSVMLGQPGQPEIDLKRERERRRMFEDDASKLYKEDFWKIRKSVQKLVQLSTERESIRVQFGVQLDDHQSISESAYSVYQRICSTDTVKTVKANTDTVNTVIPTTEIPYTDTVIPSTDTVIPYTDTVIPTTEIPYTDTVKTVIPNTEIPYTDTVNAVIPNTEIPYTDTVNTVIPNTEIPYTDTVNAVIPNTEIPYTDTVHAVIPNTVIPYTDTVNAVIPNTEIPYTDTVNTVKPNTESIIPMYDNKIQCYNSMLTIPNFLSPT
ncbi:hypothetical protein Btru_072693 [Bulinus truncatus]|nr:hypothetical protein Btru_072693 [Bulinus truncatus]